MIDKSKSIRNDSDLSIDEAFKLLQTNSVTINFDNEIKMIVEKGAVDRAGIIWNSAKGFMTIDEQSKERNKIYSKLKKSVKETYKEMPRKEIMDEQMQDLCLWYVMKNDLQ
jgi:shikimate kinase